MKKFIISLMLLFLPLSLYMNIGQKLNDKDYVGFSVLIKYVEQFPVPSNTIENIQTLKIDIEYLTSAFEPSTNEDVLTRIGMFFTGFGRLLVTILKFAYTIILDIYNLVVYVMQSFTLVLS